MQSPVDSTTPRRGVHLGVHAQLNALGMCNKGQARVVFEFEPVSRLYKEISALFGILCRDNGIALNRHDLRLFDKDLDQLLLEFGPIIWPQPGEGNRKHLFNVTLGTLYERDLWYPRDAAVIKEGLRSLILAKKVTSATDIQALIEKRPKGTNLSFSKSSRSPVKEKPTERTTPEATWPSQNSQHAIDLGSPSTTNDERSSDSENSVTGATTRRVASMTASSSGNFSSVELRLYRKVKAIRPSEPVVVSFGSFSLKLDCATVHDCFKRVSYHISTDCSFMIFQLPEDMGHDSVLLQRGSGDFGRNFQLLLDIFRKAKKFPGKPQYRSVEIEVGLDMPLEA